ncbi:MAG: hypothetical protein ABIF18_01795 [archaeon]
MDFKQSLIGSENSIKKLKLRYNECDSPQGHRELDTTNNYCHHCHRHLKYATPEADRIRDKIQNVSWYDQSYDGSLIKRLGGAEIAAQKNLDFINGLSILEREEISEVKLRNEPPIYKNRSLPLMLIKIIEEEENNLNPIPNLYKSKLSL